MLQIIDHVAKQESCPYFIAGATARDLILHHVFGLSTGRATRDVDFGLAVENWEQFARLKQRFVAAGGFKPHPHSQQRLTYSDANFTLPIDLIPFGGVSTEQECIEWPPGREVVMNVAGFQETLATAVQVSIHESLAVPVASVPGLALLKLMAWLDRGHSTDKDVADFYRLLSTYSDAGNIDRLYDEEMPLLEAADFDLQLAGAELLGRDVIQMSFPIARDSLDRIFNKPESLERLLTQMERMVPAPEYTAHVHRLVQAFQQGLRRR